ncbi:hypothetical protein EVAR_76976_1 [Eumeta japonica]|uniref:Uncharacterized protein n=1 Tax=Eumeta variegata TaxID=151549 RepID=A0A4C1SF70_EUMVA|nr:hypothetical protein EVAR_76976_1 [Eumeta japonica]
MKENPTASSWRRRHVRALAARIPGPTPLPFIGNALAFMVKPEGEQKTFLFLDPATRTATTGTISKKASAGSSNIEAPLLHSDSDMEQEIATKKKTQRETLHVITKLLHRYGDYVGFWLGSEFNVLVKNPADVRGYLTGEIPYSQVCKREEQLALLRVAFRPLLLTNNKLNHKGPAYEFMKPYIGSGILTGGKLRLGVTYEKGVTLGNVTMSHRTRERPAECRVSPTQL